jgi:ribosomal RNA assembly protein
VIEEVSIPDDRKGVLIGRDGSFKAELEKMSRTSISVNEGVAIEGDDPLTVMRAAWVVRAVGRGFSPEKAILLLKEDYHLRIISIREESDKAIRRLMARVIGRKGATRRILEHDTNCLISVYGKTVSIIGRAGEIPAAEEAVESLIRGRSHGYVYARLRKG